MKSRWKTTGILLLSLILLVVVAAIVLPFVITLDRYKGIIEKEMEGALERDCTIGGLRLTILPRLGVKVYDLVISNPKGYSETPFLSLKALKVRVKILPLFFGRKEIASLTLDRPSLLIEKDPKGVLNIPIIGEMRGRGEIKGKVKTKESSALQKISLDRGAIREGRFTYLDRTTPTPSRTEISGIDLDIWDLSVEKRIRYRISLKAAGGTLSLAGWLGPVGETIDLEALPIQARLEGNLPKLRQLARGDIDGALRARLDLQGNTSTSLKLQGEVSLHELCVGEKGKRALEGLDLRLRPEAQLSEGGSLLILKGTLAIGEALIKFQGRFHDLLKSASGKVDFSAPQGIDLARLSSYFPPLVQAVGLKGNISLDGAFTLSPRGNPLLTINAQSPRLEITLKGTKKEQGKSRPSSPKQEGGKGTAPVDATARLAVKEGVLQGSDFKDLLVTAELRSGQLQIDRFTCTVFGGKIEGAGSYGMVATPSPFRLQARLAGVDVDALFKALVSTKGLLKGRLSGDLAMSGKGFDLDNLKKDLTGHGTVAIKDGEFTPLDLIGGIVHALGGKITGDKKTTFDNLSTRFAIKDGAIELPNITIAQRESELRLRGGIGLDGKVALDGEAHLPTSLTGDLTGKGWRFFADERGRLAIPFTLSGALDDLKINISSQRLLEQGVKGALEELLQRRRH